MTDLIVHPGLVLLIGALALPFLRGGARSAAVLALPLAALFFLWQIPDGATWSQSTSKWVDDDGERATRNDTILPVHGVVRLASLMGARAKS